MNNNNDFQKTGAYAPIDSKDINDNTNAVHVETMMMDNANSASFDFVRGQVQEPAYRDKWFAVAFLAQLGVVMATALAFVISPSNSSNSSSNSNTTPGLRWLQQEDNEVDSMTFASFGTSLMVAFVLTIVVTIVCMQAMHQHGVRLIQASLLSSIGLNLLLAIFGFAAADDNGDSAGSGVFFLILAAIFACYAKAVWHRIPFAAANLKVAVTVVQSNLGVLALALANIGLTLVWIGMWIYVYFQVLASPWFKAQVHTVEVTDDDIYQHNKQHTEDSLSAGGVTVVLLLFLSLYWTWHVLRNIFHTSYAGTVGTWWFVPHEASHVCSVAITDSVARACTYSLGSICLGSLIVAILDLLRSMVRSAAHNRRNVLACVCLCLLDYLERLALYFNKWAFCYVGLYGYSYMEAGKNVMTLFQHVGWTNLINDVLVARLLGLTSFLIGLVVGGISALVGWMLGDAGAATGIVALVCGMGAWMISYRLLSTLMSCMDAVMVLYAEAPAELETNYPHLALEMKTAWEQAWPDVFTNNNNTQRGNVV